jgi:hypothetical protein
MANLGGASMLHGCSKAEELLAQLLSLDPPNNLSDRLAATTASL